MRLCGAAYLLAALLPMLMFFVLLSLDSAFRLRLGLIGAPV